MMTWIAIDPRFRPDMLGFIPEFFDDADPRPAREQIDANYRSGWYPIPGLTLQANWTLTFPGDPPFMPLALTMLRNEVIVFYRHAFLMIAQADGSFEVARVD